MEETDGPFPYKGKWHKDGPSGPKMAKDGPKIAKLAQDWSQDGP